MMALWLGTHFQCILVYD
uniref:Uncharacterized protein n=1 Tax=Rhizophora mucronata TaxID=61149 RepID=A0A2P2N7G3_RHIMU